MTSSISISNSMDNIEITIEYIQRQEQEYKNLLLRLEQEKNNLIKEQERIKLDKKEQERLELDMLDNKRIKILPLKNDSHKKLSSNENIFSDENLLIIQEALLQDLSTKYPIPGYILSKFKEFKIVGIIYDKEGPYEGSYRHPGYPGIANWDYPQQKYTYFIVYINYIDIYGNIYKAKSHTHYPAHRGESLSGYPPHVDYPILPHEYVEAMYNRPFSCKPREGDVITPDLLIPILNKKYCIGSNIYQSYISIKEKEDEEIKIKQLEKERENKIREYKTTLEKKRIERNNTINILQEYIKSDLQHFIQLNLEDNNDFIPYYKYIVNIIFDEQVPQTILLTRDDILEHAMSVFNKKIKQFKMDLLKYAKLRSRGITDPSYLEIIKSHQLGKI
jgi:hypothetical protein